MGEGEVQKMLRLTIVLVALLTVVKAAVVPADMPEPGELALLLNEDDFEDYLEAWLANEQALRLNNETRALRSGCTVNVNDLGQPQPVYLQRNNYLIPSGNSGQIRLNTGDEVIIACTGTGRTILHPQISSTVATATATCVNNNLVSGSGWLSSNGAFEQLTCSSHSFHEAQGTATTCHNNNMVIRNNFTHTFKHLGDRYRPIWGKPAYGYSPPVLLYDNNHQEILNIDLRKETSTYIGVGFIVNNVFYPLYWSCFDQTRMEVLYVWYQQNTENASFQSNVDRPSWLAGSFFPGTAINTLYTQVSQKAAIASLVGETLADQYVTTQQFLARGHLAAKTDFIYATGQRSSFYFINAAPQWQPFNAGNWNWLEQNLRTRIGNAGYQTTIYTGTFGVTQLRNANGQLVDIYLNTENRLPVPLYFYKVVYDASRQLGTAFISINNPHYTLQEARALQFCTDHCRNNNAFSWLNWQPDRVDIGYSFCCTVNDFRNVIPHLPWFSVNGLLS